jgi:hypothetical protein
MQIAARVSATLHTPVAGSRSDDFVDCLRAVCVRLGVDYCPSILVMLNLFQHPWTERSSGTALEEMADHGS